jgi:hypothetical protein
MPCRSRRDAFSPKIPRAKALVRFSRSFVAIKMGHRQGGVSEASSLCFFSEEGKAATGPRLSRNIDSCKGGRMEGWKIGSARRATVGGPDLRAGRRKSLLQISSQSRLHVHVDGRPIGTTPVRFRILPTALSVIAPAISS